MGLNKYTTLGRSGLRVSPLCLGTMTFGADWGWGAEESISRDMFNRYVDAAGNFIDTADGYTGGHSEELVGKFVAERKLRDRVVIATKFTFNGDPAIQTPAATAERTFIARWKVLCAASKQIISICITCTPGMWSHQSRKFYQRLRT